MKNSRLLLVTKVSISGFIIAMLIFTFSACVKKEAFITSQVVPAARGFVKINRDNNKNYVIHLEITGLAEVKRLQPSKNVYVVWMDSEKGPANNIGQINSSTHMLSKALKASFQSVSSSKPSKIYITAENEASAEYPDTMIVLSTGNF